MFDGCADESWLAEKAGRVAKNRVSRLLEWPSVATEFRCLGGVILCLRQTPPSRGSDPHNTSARFGSCAVMTSKLDPNFHLPTSHVPLHVARFISTTDSEAIAASPCYPLRGEAFSAKLNGHWADKPAQHAQQIPPLSAASHRHWRFSSNGTAS